MDYDKNDIAVALAVASLTISAGLALGIGLLYRKLRPMLRLAGVKLF